MHDDDLDSEFRRLVAQLETERTTAGKRPSRASMREVRREARARNKARRGAARRSSAPVSAIAVTVTLLLVAGAVLIQWRSGSALFPVSSTDPAAPAQTTASPRSVPTPGHEEAAAPLGTPPTVADVPGGYRFMFTQGDGTTPVAYDPCRPVHYVVNPVNEPQAGPRLLRDAFASVSAATGLRFVDDGSTTETSSRGREPYQPTRYGDRWAPVLVSWPTGRQQPDFVGNTIGEAGSTYAETAAGHRVYVTGDMQLDADWFDHVLSTRHGTAEAESVVLHELGHLVGLDHVTDRSQIMFAMETPSTTRYGAGDLAGLARLGSGACEPGV